MHGPLGRDGRKLPPAAVSEVALPVDTGPERDAWTVLAAIDGLGPVAFDALLARYGNGRAILAESGAPGGIQRLAATPSIRITEDGRHGRAPVSLTVAQSIAAAGQDSGRIMERIGALGLRVLIRDEAAYPARLAAVAMPPHVLFVRGNVDALTRRRSIALVGTRRPTASGRTLAGRLAVALVRADATVVSGLAYGIDGAAHEATVRAGGTTVAVIGGGHASLSPAAHARLADAIVRSGGAVVSEYAPDVVPTTGTFPRRNRVISGLADATVVVEAPARSGALITASWALEQGRGCYLVPGGLDAPASAGCLSFLREFHDEARVVAGIPQLMADLGLFDPVEEHTMPPLEAAALAELGPTASRLGAALVAGRNTVDELTASLDLPVATVLAGLTMLERRGLAVGVHGRYRPAGALLGEARQAKPR